MDISIARTFLEVVKTGSFVGAATIAQVKLFNNHPSGKVLAEERLRALAGDGGGGRCFGRFDFGLAGPRGQ